MNMKEFSDTSIYFFILIIMSPVPKPPVYHLVFNFTVEFYHVFLLIVRNQFIKMTAIQRGHNKGTHFRKHEQIAPG